LAVVAARGLLLLLLSTPVGTIAVGWTYVWTEEVAGLGGGGFVGVVDEIGPILLPEKLKNHRGQNYRKGVTASNFGPYGNFGLFFASSVASLDE
jgi:hypothetical protein